MLLVVKMRSHTVVISRSRQKIASTADSSVKAVYNYFSYCVIISSLIGADMAGMGFVVKAGFRGIWEFDMDMLVVVLVLIGGVVAPIVWAHLYSNKHAQCCSESVECRAFLLINMIVILLILVMELLSGGNDIFSLMGFALSRFFLNSSALLVLGLAMSSAILLYRGHFLVAMLAGIWSLALVLLSVLGCYEMNHIFIAHFGMLIIQLTYCLVVAVISFRYALLLHHHYHSVSAEQQEHDLLASTAVQSVK